MFVPVHRFSCEAAAEHHIKSTISAADKQLSQIVLEEQEELKKDAGGEMVSGCGATESPKRTSERGAARRLLSDLKICFCLK